MADTEPTEHISCGRCQTVNNVPYGLDKFKCYNCSVTVAIAREVSAACAAATPRELAEARAGSAPEPKQQVEAVSDKGSDKGGSGGGFFAKLQKTMDKTMQKVEKLAGGSAVADGPTRRPESREMPGAATQQHSAAPTPSFSSEDEQIQWALRASLLEEESRKVVDADKTATVSSKAAANGRGADNVASQAAQRGNASVQTMASQAAHLLQAAELRAARAERALVQAQAQEGRTNNERSALKEQLEENESLISGLTSQLDVTNARIEASEEQHKVVEASIAEDMPDDDDNSESEAEVAQLLERIAKLEGLLHKPSSATMEQQKVDTAQEQVRQTEMIFAPPSRVDTMGSAAHTEAMAPESEDQGECTSQQDNHFDSSGGVGGSQPVVGQTADPSQT